MPAQIISSAPAVTTTKESILMIRVATTAPQAVPGSLVVSCKFTTPAKLAVGVKVTVSGIVVGPV